MTEADWHVSTDPEAMLTYLADRISARKLRLFVCACCRETWPLVTMAACKRAVEVGERFADGLVTLAEMSAVHAAAQHARPLFADANYAATLAAVPALDVAGAVEVAASATAARVKIVALPAYSSARAAVATGAAAATQSSAWAAYDDTVHTAEGETQRVQADLLRELVGDPFQPFVGPACWPATVVQLAEAVYQGGDGAYALHDALLEADGTALAEHFQAAWHPLGCWALDAILGRR